MEEVEALVRAILGEGGRPELIGLARRIAEAEVDLRRLRLLRAATEYDPEEMFDPAVMNPAIRRGGSRDNPSMQSLCWTITRAERDGAYRARLLRRRDKGMLMQAVDPLHRSERAALAQRRSAIQAYDAVRTRDTSIEAPEPRDDKA